MGSEKRTKQPEIDKNATPRTLIEAEREILDTNNFLVRLKTTIIMQSDKQTKTSKSTIPMTRLGCTLLLSALADHAAAFQSAQQFQVSCPAVSTSSDSRGGLSNNNLLLRPSSRSSIVSTRLQYREGNDESSTTSRLKWLNTIFPTSPREEDDEQQSVDEYLEFLDRRYRRLHSSEKEEGPKPFSALGWLKQTSPSRNEIIVSEQQKEDALYVLGVAGLASQKLLQRHHLPVDEDKLPAHLDNTRKTVDFVEADLVQSTMAGLFIKKIVVPLLRVIYVAQRRKETFVDEQLHRIKKFSSSVIRNAGKTVVHGPVAAVKSALEFGGGKRSLALTFAAAWALFFLLRPIIQAVVTEGAVRA